MLETTGFSVFQNSPDYVVVLERDWSVHYANPSFQVRFCPAGMDAEKKFFDYLDTPSNRRVREMEPQFFFESRRIDLNHITPESSTATVHYCFFPLPVEDSRKPLVAGVGRDRAGDLATLLEVIQLNLELGHREKQLQEANARLEVLSNTDQITQIYNRHYFFQVAQHFWEEARRYKLPLTVMMMDLDDFKAVNDHHGHLFGDHVLQQASARLKSNTRKSDILARYGGEEIVLLAPNTDLQTGLVLSERLRLAVGSEPYVMGNCSATVTISVGISGTELGEFPSFEELLDSSDRALYGAKSAGKNQVCQYAPGLQIPQ
ncbi:MAG: diguanylate cyclase [Acidobacteria bacterium]|nr:diguanylate cyclase [Acidobacteriota bacterium]